MTKKLSIAVFIIVSILIIVEIISVHTPAFIENYIKQLNTSTLTKIKEEIRISAHSSNQIPKDYSKLFVHLSPIDREKLKLEKTLIFNYRYPVSNFKYNDLYYLQLFKIGYVGKTSLKSLIIEISKNLEPFNINIPFTINQQGLFNFLYNPYMQLNLSSIYLSIQGTQTKNIVLNDTTAYYYSNLEKLTIKYGQYESEDLYIEGRRSTVPFEILFLKKCGNLYLIMLSIKDQDAKLNPNLLLDLSIE